MKISLITYDEFVKRTKYWVLTEDDYCPVCGRTQRYKTQYLESEVPKPDDPYERYKISSVYDYCTI